MSTKNEACLFIMSEKLKKDLDVHPDMYFEFYPCCDCSPLQWRSMFNFAASFTIGDCEIVTNARDAKKMYSLVKSRAIDSLEGLQEYIGILVSRLKNAKE